MTEDIIFSSLDGIDLEKFIVSTYSLETERSADALSIAREIAVGQTTGTWVPVPEETDEIRERHVGRVVGIYEAPPYEREIPEAVEKRHFILQIAIPCHQSRTPASHAPFHNRRKRCDHHLSGEAPRYPPSRKFCRGLRGSQIRDSGDPEDSERHGSASGRQYDQALHWDKAEGGSSSSFTVLLWEASTW